MPTTTALRNIMLNAIDIDLVQLHSGDPGEEGNQNAVGNPKSCSFASASNSRRYLASAVVWEQNELPPNQTVSWVTFWKAGSPNQLRAMGQLSGDTKTNSRGEFTITTDTYFQLGDA